MIVGIFGSRPHALQGRHSAATAISHTFSCVGVDAIFRAWHRTCELVARTGARTHSMAHASTHTRAWPREGGGGGGDGGGGGAPRTISLDRPGPDPTRTQG